MTYYVVRDSGGTMRAHITLQAAKEIFASANGKWRPYTTKTVQGRCYEIAQDAVLTVAMRVRIYLWAGDVIIEMEE